MNTSFEEKCDIIYYRNLYMLEIEYSNITKRISKKKLFKIIGQLNNKIKMVSVVADVGNISVEFIKKLIKILKSKNISVSLTLKGIIKNNKLLGMKNITNQIRFIVEKINEDYIRNLYQNFKTSLNDIIFIVEVGNLNDFERKIKPLIEKKSYIFNINVSNDLKPIDYWKLAENVSMLKKKYPFNVLYDMPCASIKYHNLVGLCPGFVCLLCLDVDGFGKFCYKDEGNRKYNIKDYSLNEIFDNLYKDYLPEISCEYFDKCFGGCPLHRLNKCNKYCGLEVKLTD